MDTLDMQNTDIPKISIRELVRNPKILDQYVKNNTEFIVTKNGTFFFKGQTQQKKKGTLRDFLHLCGTFSSGETDLSMRVDEIVYGLPRPKDE